MTEAPPFLAARGLRKEYPGVLAVDGADLDLASGEIVGLLGKNGAGKSTVIKLLAGSVTPDAGEVRIDGGDRADPIREHLHVGVDQPCRHANT